MKNTNILFINVIFILVFIVKIDDKILNFAISFDNYATKWRCFMKSVMAIDMGATSIRAFIGKIQNNKLVLDEILRIKHKRCLVDDRVRWDWEYIISSIVNIIKKYGDSIDSIGVCTWGVDFCYMDIDNNLIEYPISYRDGKHNKGFDYVFSKISKKYVYNLTGNQIMPINTLYQLITLKIYYENLYKSINKILCLPDYINYILGGKMYMEESIFSTTQMYNIKNHKVAKELLDKFGIEESLFSPIISAGEIIGNTKHSTIKELNKFDIPIISVASHDTASATMMTQAYKDYETLFLSCGTWSLLGCFVDEAIINDESFEYEITNEIGYKSKNMFLKNITGLYLIEKLKKHIETSISRKLSFEEISDYVKNNSDEVSIIDIDREIYSFDEYDIVEEINNELRHKGHKMPEFYMDYFSIIYRSLVRKYKEVKEYMQNIIGINFRKIHVIGGGSKSELLLNMIEKELEIEVIKGNSESTVLGNLITQLITLGEIKNLEEGYKLLK